MLYFPKFLLQQIPTVMSSMIFSKYFFIHRIEYLFFVLLKSLLLFKSLILTTIEVYNFHALINRIEEKILQWSYNVIASKLQCDNFKLPKQVLLTFLGEVNSHVSRLWAGHFIFICYQFFSFIRKSKWCSNKSCTWQHRACFNN